MGKVGDFMDDVSKYKVFTVKYNNTDPNNLVHKAFIEFAWAETDGNYLMALKKLLENYSEDYRYNSLYLQLEDLKGSVVSLNEQPVKKDLEKKSEVF